MSGVIAWQGESRLNQKPIRLVLTGFGEHASKNTKTGQMIQSWILLQDMWPLEAITTGQDEAICGDCKMRGDKGKDRRCYVSIATGMRWVGVNLHKDLYPRMYHMDVGADMMKGHSLRIGTYGDPAAVPAYVWKGLLKFTNSWTGYTHQWRDWIAHELKDICMASVDTEEEAAEAQAKGWRTFRVRTFDPTFGPEPVLENEFVCPASDEGGHKTTCQECQLCKGTATQAKNIAIIDHGRKARTARERLGGQLHLPVLTEGPI